MSTSTTGVQDRTLVRRSARGPVNRNEVLLEVGSEVRSCLHRGTLCGISDRHNETSER